MLTVVETTSLFSQHKRHTWGNGPPPLSRLVVERKKEEKTKKEKRQDRAKPTSQPIARARSLRTLLYTLPIRSHQSVKPTNLSLYCHCSDRYPAPLVAHTSLKCAKHVTDSKSIREGCSINYVQFIKLHRKIETIAQH